MLRISRKSRYFVAQGHQVIRDGERGGAGSYAGYAFAVFTLGSTRQKITDVTFMIRGHTF